MYIWTVKVWQYLLVDVLMLHMSDRAFIKCLLLFSSFETNYLLSKYDYLISRLLEVITCIVIKQ